jgi:4-hydroxy-tetrahydrodipicolinate reductase
MIRVIVSGAAGRMGRRLLELVQQDPETIVVGALESVDHPAVGQAVASLITDVPAGKAGDVSVTADIPAGLAADVVIDFSVPEQSLRLARVAAERGLPIVVGTTGLNAAQKEELQKFAASTALLFAPNFSVGMNAVFRLAAEAARLLGASYDIEIVESHHRFKKDAPSGTALRLAERVAEATGRDLDKTAVYGRQGMPGARTSAEIGIHALRRGDIVGEHSVIFTSLGETVEIVHRAHSRDAFARGAVQAAKWLAGKPAGSYAIEQVLGGVGSVAGPYRTIS